MMQWVEFNTEEKAKKVFQMLGKRGAFFGELKYKNQSQGFYVCYFTK